MKVSINDGKETGYYGRGCIAMLDGKVIETAQEADDEHGYVRCFIKQENNKEMLKVTLLGNVQIIHPQIVKKWTISDPKKLPARFKSAYNFD